ncbi:MAG: NAD(P)-dependent glycerol-3-phosphate dehydrogenase [Chloroflexi bacterium]|nr:NAD(P)-dependent glycerol-3-phosphate dehydrogenase [Chloroflexota bacterium]MBV9599773.1 NAD(P)-dependent glycerol-3-phosphate dehydrogenase [Chloroflexota bacterium]
MPGHLAVINAGGWGTALAVLLGNAGHPVRLWCRRAELAAEIEGSRENRAYLPGVSVPPPVWPTASLEDAVVGAEAVILVPISRATRETARRVAAFLRAGTPVVHASKGLESPSLLRLSQVVSDELRADHVAVLSGPTHAEEVGRGMPTAAVVACGDAGVAATFQRLLHGSTFRVYTSGDVVGVELCAALKNVVALATGAADGLGYGDNARAALITRSLVEIGRLVQGAGGDPRSVAGLAGLGDVVATCTSRHSRNRWAGEQIGRGRTVAEIVSSTPKVVEGIPAAAAAVALGARYGVDLPVCEQVDQVLNHGVPVQEALARLMGREATVELPFAGAADDIGSVDG